MSKGKQHCKYYLSILNKSKVSGPMFHTSRHHNIVLPNLARGERYSEPDYLQCLRPAVVRVSDMPTLAGDPRAHRQCDHGIKPEIVQKWNESPRKDVYKEWSKLSVFY